MTAAVAAPGVSSKHLDYHQTVWRAEVLEPVENKKTGINEFGRNK